MKSLLKDLQEKKLPIQISKESFGLINNVELEKLLSRIIELSATKGENNNEQYESKKGLHESLNSFRNEINHIQTSLEEVSLLRESDISSFKDDIENIKYDITKLSSTNEKGFSEINKIVMKIMKESILPIENHINHLRKEHSETIVKHSNKYDSDIVSIYNKFQTLEEIIGKIPKDIYEFGSQLTVSVGGLLVGITSYLNFKSGFTAVPNGLGIDIIATGGGGGGSGAILLTTTSAINNSNTTFTFTNPSGVTTLPTLLVINGFLYRQNGGAITWTISGNSVVLSSAVGINGSIFGIFGTTIIEMTGTINGTNETFTMAIQPIYSVMNGAAYLPNSNISWTYSSGTLVMSSPPGSGGSIFGLSGISLTVDANGIISGFN